MRNISYLYIVKMSREELDKYVQEAKEAGLIYHPAHFVYSMANTEGNVHETKYRPINNNNGLTRDGIISKRSIGIVIVLPAHIDVPIKTYSDIATKIKTLSVDIGLSSLELVTDFKNDKNKINIGIMFNELKNSSDTFEKLNKGL